MENCLMPYSRWKTNINRINTLSHGIPLAFVEEAYSGIEKMIPLNRERFFKKTGFLSAGWWIIHLVGISVVYTLGHYLWR